MRQDVTIHINTAPGPVCINSYERSQLFTNPYFVCKSVNIPKIRSQTLWNARKSFTSYKCSRPLLSHLWTFAKSQVTQTHCLHPCSSSSSLHGRPHSPANYCQSKNGHSERVQRCGIEEEIQIWPAGLYLWQVWWETSFSRIVHSKAKRWLRSADENCTEFLYLAMGKLWFWTFTANYHKHWKHVASLHIAHYLLPIWTKEQLTNAWTFPCTSSHHFA